MPIVPTATAAVMPMPLKAELPVIVVVVPWSFFTSFEDCITSPDWLTLELLVRVLGGEGGNRLFGELRTDRGLTYGASADLQTFKFAGGFVASTNTRTEATGEALRVLVDQLWRLQREPVRMGEMAGVKDYFTGSFPLAVETPSAPKRSARCTLGVDR